MDPRRGLEIDPNQHAGARRVHRKRQQLSLERAHPHRHRRRWCSDGENDNVSRPRRGRPGGDDDARCLRDLCRRAHNR
jgi:hypothetical protein